MINIIVHPLGRRDLIISHSERLVGHRRLYKIADKVHANHGSNPCPYLKELGRPRHYQVSGERLNGSSNPC